MRTLRWATALLLGAAVALAQVGSTLAQTPAGFETRAQFVAQLDKALGIAPISPAVADFRDVPTTDPNYGYIEAAYRAGYISGFRPGIFGPNAPITRAEAAKVEVLAAGLGAEAAGIAATSFADNAQIPRSLVPYVAVAAKSGLLKGFKDNTFHPNAFLTAAQQTYLLQQLVSTAQPVSLEVSASGVDVLPGTAVTLGAEGLTASGRTVAVQGVTYQAFGPDGASFTLSGNTFTATTTGAYRVQAASGQIIGSVTIVVSSAAPAAGLPSASRVPTTVDLTGAGAYTADQGHSGIAVTAVVLDQTGLPMPNILVQFASHGLSGAIINTPVLTNQDGQATADLIATQNGTGTVTASVSGTAVSRTSGSIVVGSGVLASLSAAAPPALTGQPDTVALTAMDTYANPISGTYAVQVSGVKPTATNPAEYGTFGGNPIVGGTGSANVTFANGTANVPIVLDAAATHALTFSVGAVAAGTIWVVATLSSNAVVTASVPTLQAGLATPVQISVRSGSTGLSGLFDIAVSGVLAAPDGSFGSFGGVPIVSPGSAVVTAADFVNGTASLTLQLDDAAQQQVLFTVGQSVSNPIAVAVDPGPARYVSAQPPGGSLVAGGGGSWTIRAYDAYHNALTGTHTVTVTGAAVAPSGAYGAFEGATIQGTPPGAGSASYSAAVFTAGSTSVNLALDAATTQDIAFAVDGLLGSATAVGIAAGIAQQVTLSPSALTEQAGSADPIGMALADAYGNPVSGTFPVAVSQVNAAPDATSYGAIASGGNSATIASGSATLTGVVFTGGAASVQLTLDAAGSAAPAFTVGGTVQGTLPSAIAVTSAAPATASLVSPPTTMVAGTAEGITLQAHDSFGNPVAGSQSVQVSGAAAAPAAATDYGSLDGIAIASGSATDGSVTFGGGEGTVEVALDAATGQVLQFTVGGVAAGNAPVTVASGPAVSGSATVASTATAGTPILVSFSNVKDVFGNLVSGSQSVTVSGALSPPNPAYADSFGGASVSAGVASTSAKFVAGATSSGISLTLDAAGAQPLSFAIGGTPIVTATVAVSPGALAVIGLGGPKANSGISVTSLVAGVPTQVTMLAQDAYGNGVAGTQNVKVTGVQPAPNGSYGSIGGTSFATAGSPPSGTATISVSFSAAQTASISTTLAAQLTASATQIIVSSSVGVPNTPFYATLAPGSSTGTPPGQPAETVQVTSVSADIWTVTRAAAGSVAELWNVGDVISASGTTGVAGVSQPFGLTLDGAGSQTLQYYVGSAAMGQSAPYAVGVGAANSLLASSSSYTVSHANNYTVTLTLTDAFGNPESGTISVSATGETGGGTLDGVAFSSGSATDPNVTFGSNGQATVTLVFAAAGSENLTFYADGVAGTLPTVTVN